MGVSAQRHALAALSRGKSLYPSYKRLDGPEGRSGLVRTVSPPPGFDPRTFQPVPSRYTDYTIPAHDDDDDDDDDNNNNNNNNNNPIYYKIFNFYIPNQPLGCLERGSTSTVSTSRQGR